MAKYNVSKSEAKKLGIERVKFASTKSSGTSDIQKQIGALQRKYTETISPTSEELDTQTQLGNVITSKELGIAKAEQEPMAQQFVTGQSAGLEKSAALKSLPLQTRLANLQSQRQAAADVLKTQLGFASEELGRRTQQEENAYNRAFQEKQFKEGVRQFNVQQAKSGRASSEAGTSAELRAVSDALSKTGNNWNEAAKNLANRGFDVSSGSIIDNELRRRFGLGPVKEVKPKTPVGEPKGDWQYFSDGSRENIYTGEIQIWE